MDTHIHTYNNNQKEVKNLKEIKEEYMGRFRRKKWKGEMYL